MWGRQQRFPMTDDKLVRAYISDMFLAMVSDYVRRGRSLQILPEDDLKTVWVARFRAWADDTSSAERRQQWLDADSEIRLRRLEPPSAVVEAELRRLEDRLRELKKNPRVMEMLVDELAKDLAEFDAAVAAARKN
jgi:hypothetical protein